PYFYPKNVYTPYFYFALALEKDLNWSVEKDGTFADLKTSPGNIWINPPKTPFTHDVAEPCYFVILAIEEQEFFSHCPLNLEGIELQFLNNYNVLDETIKGIIELFMLEVKAKGRNGKTYLNNLVSLLATHYIQNYSNYFDLKNNQIAASKFDQHQVDKIDQYIEENIGNNIAVDDLADLLGCSKFYFLREFKKLIGVTPYQYLMNKRLEQARVALSSGSVNIALTAHELGFNDQSHFTRAFKNHFGMTPGQFVKQQES
ncbi:AraC family transcriptional regulator, partial [Vibrio owensii]